MWETDCQVHCLVVNIHQYLTANSSIAAFCHQIFMYIYCLCILAKQNQVFQRAM